MQNLIAKVITETGLPEQEVQLVVNAVADYVKEKYPLLSGTVDMLLEQQGAPVQS